MMGDTIFLKPQHTFLLILILTFVSSLIKKPYSFKDYCAWIKTVLTTWSHQQKFHHLISVNSVNYQSNATINYKDHNLQAKVISNIYYQCEAVTKK